MIDLHCHIIPGIDDGARDLDASLAMARAFVADGVTTVACTPHILPGVYQNTGPQIRSAVADLQRHLGAAHIPLRLVPGADNHVVPDLVAGLRAGRLLTVADSRYALVEPPHHVPPPRLEETFFGLLVGGYVPILTHPERLTWIEKYYDMIIRLCDGGVWMQITAGSLTGTFGRTARYWAEKMLCEGRVHILATDAHDTVKRPPELGRARIIAAQLVGEREAELLVTSRPAAVLANAAPSSVERPAPIAGEPEVGNVTTSSNRADSGGLGGFAGRLRRLLE